VTADAPRTKVYHPIRWALPLVCIVVMNCAQPGARRQPDSLTTTGGPDRSFGQRVATFRRLLAKLPACDPASVGSTDLVASPGTLASVVGTLELTVDMCASIDEEMAGPPSARGPNSSESCGPCGPHAYDQWTLAPPAAQPDEIYLSMTFAMKTTSRPMDCDGRAFAEALGKDRLVMVTGGFPAPPPSSPSAHSPSEGLLMQVRSQRRMAVEQICRVAPPPP